MNKTLKADLCIIGAGSGGLSVAAGAVQMGASVILIEKHRMGGDCLNTGCVPSKALLAAAHSAENIRRSKRFGITAGTPKINDEKVYGHVRSVINTIAPNDSVERFEKLGVTVIQAAAQFLDRKTVEADGKRIQARRFVIATGSSPVLPPVPGLDKVGALSNETLFDQSVLPEHLIILGGGPIGVEMAQAHRQLGCKVSVLEMFSLLPRDDQELSAVVRNALVQDGVDIFEGITITRAEKTPKGVDVFYKTSDDDTEIRLCGSHILVAAGRRANTAGLGLEQAGVDVKGPGIHVDKRLRTSNKNIFAIGDVAGGMQFTHVAGHQAGIVIRNALFRLPAKYDDRAVPRVTYSDPELATVGLGEAEARQKFSGVRVLTRPFADNDRAATEQDTAGLIKVICKKNGLILGCGIVGTGAGELIAPWVVAIHKKMKISAMAGAVFPYPTRSEISKHVAGSFYTPTLFSERTQKIVRFLRLFG